MANSTCKRHLLWRKFSDLEAHQLAVQATSDRKLQFERGWSHEECHEWLRQLLPTLFEYNDSCTKPSAWHLFIRTRSELSVAHFKNPDGEALFKVKGRSKARIDECRIYFSMSSHIPTRRKSLTDDLKAFAKAIRRAVWKEWSVPAAISSGADRDHRNAKKSSRNETSDEEEESDGTNGSSNDRSSSEDSQQSESSEEDETV